MTIKYQWIIVGAILVALSVYPLHLFLTWRDQVGHNEDGVGLHQIQLCVLQYAEDNQGCLPPMKDLGAFHQAILVYAVNPVAFSDHDNTQVLFLPNPNLSGRRLSTVHNVTVLLYESAPAKVDDSRWVAFLPHLPGPPPFGDPDFGDKKLVKEEDWQKLRGANHIPD